MKLLAGLTITASLFATAGLAQDCSSASTQAEMNMCAGASFQKADAELNGLYGQIRERLKGDKQAVERLTKAERAWISFRDAECDFAGSAVEDGSMQPMIVAGCKEELTEDRSERLGAYLKCEEGDTSCPVPAN